MRTARPLGLSPDGAQLIVVTDDGEEIAIPADERLSAAIRNDRPRLGQLEIDMESALRPREIQSRVRAGETLEEVAIAAGVPIEKVEPYAAPVFAERAHIAEMAQASPVRRKGETTSTRTLRVAVLERLATRGIELTEVTWDAWRIEGRRWHIQADYQSGSAARTATFVFDLQGKFSTAGNDDAQWLIGDESPAHGPQPGKKRRSDNPDAEPTLDLDDELALVRAVNVERLSDDLVDTEDDAYTPGDLTEVDGVYDIVPPTSDLDVLYDMLSTFNEDSVQIYKGLTTPVVADEALGDESEPEGADEPANAPAAVQTPPAAIPAAGVEPDIAEQPESEPVAAPESAEPTEPTAPAPARPARTKRSRPAKPNMDQPTLAAADGPTGDPAAVAPGAGPAVGAETQPDEAPAPERSTPEASTTEEPGPETTEQAKPAPRKRRRKRASVPSWDEIMFGSPTPPPTPPKAKDD